MNGIIKRCVERSVQSHENTVARIAVSSKPTKIISGNDGGKTHRISVDIQ